MYMECSVWSVEYIHVYVHVHTCLTLLASFFLPSHLSFNYMYLHVYDTVRVYMYNVYAKQL